MKIFFNCEFTGLHKNTTLISIGLVTETGDAFYAEFTNYDRTQINEWLQKNVLDKLIVDMNKDITYFEADGETDGNPLKLIGGSKKFIAGKLKEWLWNYRDIEMWSDCLAYDWVLFIDIFGDAFDLPRNINYIPFDICTLFKIKGIDPDISREEFAEEYDKSMKHNALYDTKVIKKCYEKLMKL